MARLPQPGSDSGKWGDILNEYLSQSHNTDGTIKVGAVTKADIGLSNVDNTSDANKPISVFTQAALDQKLTTASLDSQTAAKIQDSESATSGALSALTTTQMYGTDDIAGWGHSMMAAGWIMDLEATLGVDVYNGGVGGMSSSDIAIRQGGLDPLVTISGDTIPTSGAVAVTDISPATSYRTNGTGSFSFVGTLAGVPGTLTHAMTPNTWSFTRTTSGSAIACPPGTSFHCSGGDDYRNRISILWNGANNVDPACLLDDSIRDLDIMIAHLTPASPRFLVLGDLLASSSSIGTTYNTAMRAVATAQAARWGIRFIDLRRLLIDSGMDMLGIAPTLQDKIDVASDVTPTSLRGSGDVLHPSTQCYDLIRQIVEQRIRSLGWRRGKFPAAKVGTVSGLAVGSVTASSVDLTWTVAAGASGYRVEYRTVGATTWSWATSVPTGAATVDSLLPGHSYEFRVTPCNINGPGTPTAAVPGATSSTAPVVVFSDSFNRANSALSGSAADGALGGAGFTWGTFASEIQVRSNALGRAATGTTNRYCGGPNVGAVQMAVEVVYTSLGNGWGPLVGTNSDGGTTGVFAYVNADGTLRMVSRAGTGLVGPTATGTVLAGDKVRLTLSADGKTARAYVNDVQMLSYTSGTALGTGTYAALRAATDATAIVDNFIVYDK